MNGIVVDPTTLGKTMPQGPLPVFRNLQQLGSFVLTDLKQKGAAQSHWDDMTLTQLVQVEIERRLDGAAGVSFDQPAIAETLGYSARELQWELSQLDTSYDKILVGIRESLAERYLRDSEMTLSQISVKLGFSEASAFTRWARRTYGRSPSAQRDLLQSGTVQPGQNGELGPEVGDDS
jgi:AraC-like DNA-binding protein